MGKPSATAPASSSTNAVVVMNSSRQSSNNNNATLNKLGLFLIILCVYSLSINHVLLTTTTNDKALADALFASQEQEQRQAKQNQVEKNGKSALRPALTSTSLESNKKGNNASPPKQTTTSETPFKNPSNNKPISAHKTYTCTYGNTTLTFPINTPTFIMVGVQKSGTTALLTYFREHPQILQTKKKFTRELHFFDSSWNSDLKKAKEIGLTQANEKNCYMLEQYLKLFETETVLEQQQRNQTQQLYTFEKTPSYFANPLIAKRMKQIVPHSKIILILRNPIDRLYSAYKMTIKDVFDMRQYSLEDLLQHELYQMKYHFKMTTASLLLGEHETVEAYNGTKDAGITLTEQPPPHVPFDHAISPREWTPPMKALSKYSDHGPLGHHILVRRGMYAIQLQNWMEHYELHKNLLVVNYADMRRTTQAVYEQILQFCDIPIVENDNIAAKAVIRADERKDYRPLLNSTRRYLQEFYAPYNAELEALLGPEWSVDKLGW